jgi:hypothetical protein
MRSWLVLILLAALVPMVSPSGLRLIMLLTYPLAFYATEALSMLKSVRWRPFNRTFLRVGVVYLVAVTAIFSLGFMMLPAETPFPYFIAGKMTSHIYQIPSSMLQNTVPLTDCNDTQNSVQWLKTNMDSHSVLLSHRAFYGWARSSLSKDQVILYEYDDPEVTANFAAKEGYDKYILYGVNGVGWYGQSTVPNSFYEVYSSGKIAFYCYITIN